MLTIRKTLLSFELLHAMLSQSCVVVVFDFRLESGEDVVLGIFVRV